MAYQRDLAVAYAHEWALKRNPRYLDFNGIGGDCTNFISQCLYAGGAPMNYQKLNGWYYNSASDRAPAWTGVDYFYSFLMRNQSIGPYAAEAAPEELEPGDVIQLSFDAQRYAHTLLIVDILGTPTPDNILIACHTYDSDNRPLASYRYMDARYLHIESRD